MSTTSHRPVFRHGARRDTIIVGAGVGGLTLAIRLALRGQNVLVVEKNATVGGRLNVIEQDGFRFDVGPTIMLMIDVFRDLWARAGRDFDADVPCVRLDPNYRVNFHDGSWLDMSPNLQRMVEQLEAIEPGSSSRYLEMMSRASADYYAARGHFVERNFVRKRDFFSPQNMARLLAMKPFATLYGEVSRLFESPRLRAAFTFQTMYLGISPMTCPPFYGLLPFTELGEGIWFPMGGYYSVAERMRDLAESVGVEIRLNEEVVSVDVDGRRATGVTTDQGQRLSARTVVANADLPYVYEELLPASAPRYTRLDKMSYTASAYMLYLGVRGRYDHLLHHNVYLDERFYAETFAEIFDSRSLPERPALYIHAPTRTDPSLAPAGHDNLFVLVPVPHESPHVDWDDIEPLFYDKIVHALERRAGLEGLRDRIVLSRTLTPAGWRRDYNLKYGSAFGLSHGLFQVGWFRPDNKHPEIDGLYFVGASTQPGTGVPMVMIGAGLTDERMAMDGR